MYLIGFLVILGVLLLLGELLLFSGTGIAGILSAVSYIAASYLAWVEYSWSGLIITLVIIIAASALSAVLCMRSRTWQRLKLSDAIESVSQQAPEATLTKGMTGRTITRLAPSGKVEIDGEVYEARSTELINPNESVEVVGFENFTVLVRKQ
jgi:membrane-bound serine protease (ClpP class)